MFSTLILILKTCFYMDQRKHCTDLFISRGAGENKNNSETTAEAGKTTRNKPSKHTLHSEASTWTY